MNFNLAWEGAAVVGSHAAVSPSLQRGAGAWTGRRAALPDPPRATGCWLACTRPGALQWALTGVWGRGLVGTVVSVSPIAFCSSSSHWVPRASPARLPLVIALGSPAWGQDECVPACSCPLPGLPRLQRVLLGCHFEAGTPRRLGVRCAGRPSSISGSSLLLPHILLQEPHRQRSTEKPCVSSGAASALSSVGLGHTWPGEGWGVPE